MKVVFILPGSGLSGGVRVTIVASNHLISRGHNVRILYRSTPITIKNLLRSWRNKLFYRNSDWFKMFQGKAYPFKNLSHCSFQKNEIIIAVGMLASCLLPNLNSLPNSKLQYIHEAGAWDPDLREKALSLPFPKIVVSSYLKPLAESYKGGEVLAVIHNGLDLKEYFNSATEPERDGVGVMYSSHPAKDPVTTLAVIEEIARRKRDIPIRVFSSGKRPKQIERRSFWRFASIEKTREIYSKSQVWVLASLSEGFPAPPLEAMACGCVVVATDCGGTRDMIIDGYNGFLVKVGDVKQIVDRVLLLLDDENLRNSMRLKAEESVKRFSWEDTIDKLENVLRQVS
jgi:glycosyltransferase involved in cell wall biosynthesis